MKNIICTAVVAFAIAHAVNVAHAQTVVKLDTPADLASSWTDLVRSASNEADGGFAIGYAIPRSSDRIGRNINSSQRKSLAELLDGDDAGEGSMNQNAILVSFEKGQTTPRKITASSLDSHLQFKSKVLFWIGEVDTRSSLALLSKWIDTGDKSDMQEDLQSALGVHAASKYLVGLLETSARGGATGDIREKASFWLGQTHRADALEVLVDVVNKDKSEDVRKGGVFAISQLDIEEALDALIVLTKHRDQQVQKDAVFWLSQRASDRVGESLLGVVNGETDSDVQEHAVFAISQLDADESIPMLVDLAENHPRLEVRKKAIFWLGQTEDERAVKAIIAFARK